MAVETEQWLTSSSRSKQVLHALGSFKLLHSKADKMLRVQEQHSAKQTKSQEYLNTSALSMYSIISGLYFLKALCIWFSNLWLLPMLAAEGCSPGVSINFTLTPATVPLISRILLVPVSKALVGAAASASKTLLMVALLPTPLMPMTMTVQAKGSSWSADSDSRSSA